MPTPSTSHVSAAQHLLREARMDPEAAADWAAAAGRVYDTLFRQLAPVIGSAGVRALIARGLKLNRRAFPELAAVHLSSDPSDQEARVAEAIVDALAPIAPDRQLALATALYATFLALLTTFIGERLTWQIVQTTFAEDDGPASKETK